MFTDRLAISAKEESGRFLLLEEDNKSRTTTTMIRMTMANNPDLWEGRTMNVGRLGSSRSATGQNSRARCGKNDDDVADILLSLCGRKRPLSEEQVVETEMIKRHIKDRVKEITKRKNSL